MVKGTMRWWTGLEDRGGEWVPVPVWGGITVEIDPSFGHIRETEVLPNGDLRVVFDLAAQVGVGEAVAQSDEHRCVS